MSENPFLTLQTMDGRNWKAELSHYKRGLSSNSISERSKQSNNFEYDYQTWFYKKLMLLPPALLQLFSLKYLLQNNLSLSCVNQLVCYNLTNFQLKPEWNLFAPKPLPFLKIQNPVFGPKIWMLYSKQCVKINIIFNKR